ncbi:Uncharacterised protein [Mannheimia haemolytica]|uniref:Uncharacterized protein n=1 Tax=Mannheimia haemolytica TaxID=75985 RepID=A0A378MXX7_MANHA|nr:Uncharacterised protein [Mannheimia haemolytica]
MNGQSIELGSEPVLKIEVLGNVQKLSAGAADVSITGDAAVLTQLAVMSLLREMLPLM